MACGARPQTEISSIIEGNPTLESLELAQIHEGELETLSEVINTPPTHILVHTYGDPTGPEAHYVLRSVVELLEEIYARHPEVSTAVLFASGHHREAEPHSTSLAYKMTLEKMLHSAGIAGHTQIATGRINVYDESTTKPLKQAMDTRGEIMFLKHWLEQRELTNGHKIKALSVGRIAHMPRIMELLRNNGMACVKTLSMETILTAFHPGIANRIIRLHPELLQNNVDFAGAESTKLKIMQTFDKRGILIELLARLAGSNLKKIMLELLRQPTT